MHLLRVLSLIQELRFNVSVSVSMLGAVGVGVGSYQPGVYVPLRALFLVLNLNFQPLAIFSACTIAWFVSEPTLLVFS